MKKYNILFIALAILMILPDRVKGQEVSYPTMKIGARIMYDLTSINYGDEQFAGQEFRRMMINAKGQVNERVEYKIHFDFAGGKVGFRDIYIKMGELPYIGGHLMIGNFAEPTGLDMLTSSNYISFIERAMFTSTQNFRWNSGFQYVNHGLLKNRMGLQMAYTFNGDRDKAFLDNRAFDGGNFVSRLYGNPYQNREKNQIVHVAVNYERRDHPDDEYKVSFRPETHFWNKVSYNANVEMQNDFGAEIAAVFGPLSVQAEYELSNHTISDENFSVIGYYAYASFFITGEHRSYKKGAFGGVKPKSDFCILENKWGAVELLARYSVMDFSSAAGMAGYDDIELESVSNLTFGLNWYLNKHTRFMYNFVLSDLSTDDNYTAHMFRAQINF